MKQANAGMPKARGHLPKKAKIEDGVSLAHAPAPAPVGDGSTPVKRGRGRPPKVGPVVPSETADAAGACGGLGCPAVRGTGWLVG